MESAWRNSNSQTQQSDPTTLTTKTLRKPHITSIPIPNLVSILKKDSIAHKRYRGATETLNPPKTQSIPPEKALKTGTNPQSQATCPNKPEATTKQIQMVENRKREHTECTLAKRGWTPRHSHRHDANVASRNLRNLLADEDTQKAEEKALTVENVEGKMQEWEARSAI